ncbi:hypothetical protein D3C78_1337780 [compost metagenome]
MTQQEQLHHQQRAVDKEDGDEAEPELPRLQQGDGGRDRQHVADGPGLTTELGHEPTRLYGNPGQGYAPEQRPEQAWRLHQPAPAQLQEGGGKEPEQHHAYAHHQPKAPEQRRHLRDGVVDRLGNGRLVRLANLLGMGGEQQAVAEIRAVTLEGGAGLGIATV